MCNDKTDNTVKNGRFEGVAGRAGGEALKPQGGEHRGREGVGEPQGGEHREREGVGEPQGAGKGVEGAGKGVGRGWTPVEKAQAVGEVYAFPEFGRSYRSVPEGGEEVANGQWSRLRGLIDWDAVERARNADERAAERERERCGAKRRAGGWTWLAISKAEDAE